MYKPIEWPASSEIRTIIKLMNENQTNKTEILSEILLKSVKFTNRI